jgi:hypothetical protein
LKIVPGMLGLLGVVHTLDEQDRLVLVDDFVPEQEHVVVPRKLEFQIGDGKVTRQFPSC